MPAFHHQKLPDFSTLLSGHTPPDNISFRSDLLQIWYNHTEHEQVDPSPHAHLESDKCSIVLQGSLLVEVEHEQFSIGTRESCCFPRGVFHRVVKVYPPLVSLMIRTPSVNDKIDREYS
ncbi:MAG TPA: cupin domain-containing protein [Ktedonobacteraceae bacterium]|jgi:mannose-6-phosphate isomerase-like protein (cupin superfamily)|nr:cupin domain-containing protein [Ktedonobacteraceae bacterium]